MCGQLRNNAVWNMKVRTWNWHPFTILLGQKTRKSPKSFFGCLKNQRFSQIRSDLYMQNHRAENRFGAVVLSFGCECSLSSQPRTHFWVPGLCELGMNTNANLENFNCLIKPSQIARYSWTALSWVPGWCWKSWKNNWILRTAHRSAMISELCSCNNAYIHISLVRVKLHFLFTLQCELSRYAWYLSNYPNSHKADVQIKFSW